MPVRNGLPHLIEAVGSIRSQTHTSWRLIVVDDGSNDGSREWLESLDDDRLVIVNSPGSGITDALNTGIEACDAPFVARMDADDISEPTRFAEQLAAFEGNSAIAVGCAYEVIDENGEHIAYQRVPTDPAVIARELRARNPFCHGTLMFRHESLMAVGGYRSDFNLAEDYDLMFRMSAIGELRNLGEPLYRWRLSHASSSARRPRAQSLGAARARRAARKAGITSSAGLRVALADLATPLLSRWEQTRPTSPEITMQLWRAGLLRGEGRDLDAVAVYDSVLQVRPLALATRFRRERARRRSYD